MRAWSLRAGKAAFAESSRTIVLDGVGPVLFEKSRRARHIGLTVRAARGVRVVVPARVSFDEARRVALTKLDWIERTLARVERARVRCREAVITARKPRSAGRPRPPRRAPGRAGRGARLLPRTTERQETRHALGQRLALRPHPAQRLLGRSSPGARRIRYPARARPCPCQGPRPGFLEGVIEGHIPDVRGCRRRLREYSLALF